MYLDVHVRAGEDYGMTVSVSDITADRRVPLLQGDVLGRAG